MYHSSDDRRLEELGLSTKSIILAQDKGYFDDGAYEYDYWSERKKFYRISFNIRSNESIVLVEQLGTDKIIEKTTFKNNQEALDYYIDIL